MARDVASMKRWQFAIQNMQVRSANAASQHTQKNVAALRFRLRHILHAQIARTSQYCCPHQQPLCTGEVDLVG